MRISILPVLALSLAACASREPNVESDEPAMPEELEVPIVEAPQGSAEDIDAEGEPAAEGEGSAEIVVEPIACESDDACGDGEFCEFPVGGCGEDGAMGTCMEIPAICTLQLDPVCGCDGIQYGNHCGAYAAGVSVRTLDTCDGSPPF